jgi:AraC-like DNA-binding protein
MVSVRCKMVVITILDTMGLHYRNLELGVVDIIDDCSIQQLDQLKQALFETGLDLLEDKRQILVERIKVIVIEMIHYSDEPIKINFSDYLSGILKIDYTYLSTLFSQLTGKTIEQYIIAHKIERVKELLLYDEINLTEISYRLHYSSVAHLSNQFKQVTGMTPTQYGQLKKNSRIYLHDL